VKLRPGLAESRFIEIPDPATYDVVAKEYYDPILHPTCADFRCASLHYLQGEFQAPMLLGRVADVGCGESLLARFLSEKNLVLIDESSEMLNRNREGYEKRQIDVISSEIGVSEFDRIYAILGDPFNFVSSWRNIRTALKSQGQCFFVVPSYLWVTKFRECAPEEREGFARFDLADGKTTYLPSFVFSEADQLAIIEQAGLKMLAIDHVYVRDLPKVRSAKISGYLAATDALLDIYRVEK
jgi:SAM-dependent methyltransferase